MRDLKSPKDGLVIRNIPDGATDEELQALAEKARAEGLKEIEFPKSGASVADYARVAGQGATLGWSDEGEAALRAPFSDRNYVEIRDEARQSAQRAREESPIGSMALELGGAMLPIAASRGRAGPTSLGGAALLGAKEGAVAGAGYTEGGLEDFKRAGEAALDIGVGAATGGAIGGAGNLLVRGGGALYNKAVDWARSKFGTRGSTAVENEILRMAEATGQTPDEILDAINRGEIMADNATLREAVRAVYAKGDDAVRRDITASIEERTPRTRREGVEALRGGLAPVDDTNVTRYYNMSEEAFKKAEGDSYNQIFGQGIEVPQLTDTLTDAIIRVKRAGADLEEIYETTPGNLVPPYKVNDNGAIEWVRVPTLQDAEIVRRAASDSAFSASTGGRGQVGTNLRILEGDLRKGIDDVSPELKATRAQWATIEANRKAFDEGKKIFSKQSEDMEIFVEGLNPKQIEAARMGFMSAINNRMTVGGRKTLAMKLSDQETKEGRAFRALFPQDQQRSVLNKLIVSGKAQETSNRILGGSQTAATLERADKLGRNITADDIAGTLVGNPISAMRVASELMSGFKGLSQKDQRKIVEILMSEDPAVVQQALKAPELRAKLSESVLRKAGILGGAATAPATEFGTREVNRS